MDTPITIKEELLDDWKQFLARKEDTLVEWVSEFLEDFDLDEDDGQEAWDAFAEDILRRFPELQ